MPLKSIKYYKQAKITRTFMGSLSFGCGLLEAIEEFSVKNKIKAGVFNIIGATKNGRFAVYDQKSRSYNDAIEIDNELEIVSCLGNISLKDGKVFAHAHIVFTDEKGRAFGGHLLKGTKVFAGEFVLHQFSSQDFKRSFDKTTGLYLW